ncbi:MAG: leucine-rich repeat protein, partial [Anaeroplasmataceae bacterium]|nr:leucine-rich repeat protein [Anaeroplasmataceae bacterium]
MLVQPTEQSEGSRKRICQTCLYEQVETVPHIHTFSTDWKSNEKSHYLECDCGAREKEEDHRYGEWSILKEPTLESTGIQSRSCKTCKYVETKAIPQLEHTHSYSSVWEMDEQYHYKKCSCGEKNSLGLHSFGTVIVIIPPTETTVGEGKYICIDCGYQQIIVLPIVVHSHYAHTYITNDFTHQGKCICGELGLVVEHKYGEWQITKEPTALEEGSRNRTCLECEYHQIDIMPVIQHEHEFSDKYISDATTHWLECRCGSIENKEEHIYRNWVTIEEPTDLKNGLEGSYCETCGHYGTRVISSLSHTHDFTASYQSNETMHWIECACGQKDYLALHTFGEYTIILEPTDFTQGTEIRVCFECGYIDEREIPMLPHYHYDNFTYLWDEVSHYKKCSCGIQTEEESHILGDWEVALEPTLTDSGYNRRSCTICGYDEIIIVPSLSHIHSAAYSEQNLVAHWNRCSCGEIIDKEYHSYGEWISFENNKRKQVCLDCSYEYIDEHNFILDEVNLCLACSHCDECYEYTEVLSYILSEKENDYYTLVVDSYLPTTSLSGYILYSAQVKNLSGFMNDCTALSYQSSKIEDITFGKNISAIYNLGSYFEQLQTVIFGEDIVYIGEDTFLSSSKIESFKFLGDMPELGKNALYIPYSSTGSAYTTIYYEPTSIGFDGYAICGNALKVSNQPIPTLPNMTMADYAHKTAEKSLEIATNVFSMAETSETKDLFLMPIESLKYYKQIKDFTLELTKNCTTQVQKARKIYDWITENISYDANSVHSTVYQVFTEKTAVCNGYVILMHDMLASVGIMSLYVSGEIDYDGINLLTLPMILSGTYKTDTAGNHAWIMIYDGQNTIVCDPTMGVSDQNRYFDMSTEVIADTRITCDVSNIDVVIDEIHPSLFTSTIVYYLDGECYLLSEGNLLHQTQTTEVTYNNSYSILFQAYKPNTGYISNKDDTLIIGSLYYDAFIEDSSFDYAHSSIAASNYQILDYYDALSFVLYSNKHYDTDYVIANMENFFMDDNDFIYQILEDGSLSLIYSLSHEESIEIPEVVNDRSVTRIGLRAFYDSQEMTSLVIPDSVVSIAPLAFALCSNLRDVRLSKKLTTIEPGAFANCTSLESIILPKTIRSIGYIDISISYGESNPFDGCTNLQTIYFEGTTHNFNDISFKGKLGNMDWSLIYSILDITYFLSQDEALAGNNSWYYLDGIPTKWE